MSQSNDSWSIYPYDPSKALPVVFGVIVSGLAVSIAYQSFVRYKWYRFGIAMAWASAVWIAGFVCREISVYNVEAVNIFIAQYVLIIAGPPIYAISEYFVLGRLLAYLPYHAPIHPGRVLSTFWFLGTAVESLAANGAGNSAGAGRQPAQRAAGIACIQASLILQAFVEALFFSLVALLHYRCKRAGHFPHNVRIICFVLYVTSTMMFVRCFVRTVEAFEMAACDPSAAGYDGYCGPVQRNEWFLWVFEVANITTFTALLTIFHPGRYLPAGTLRYLDPGDGRTERIGPGYSEACRRSWLASVLDPCDIYGAVTGKGVSVDKFWERENEVAEGSLAVPKGKKDGDSMELALAHGRTA
ncbi:hypothetical protein MMC17_000587 [Xylographa soralifera]|nr:hypothetical protein [Xylographa soralifera]